MLTLTLDGQPVDLPNDAAVALSYRSSDLRRLDSREAAFSETFALPLSAQNARVLGTPHALSSQTRSPYRRLPAVLRANGVPVLRGVAVLEASEAGYEVTLLDDTADLFGRVGDVALRDMDLSALDHARTYAAVQAASTDSPARGYVYALADTGRLASVEAGGRIAALEIPPSVYESAVLRAIVAHALPGYALAGTLFTDPVWRAAVLPCAFAGPRLREAYLAPWRVQAGAPTDQRYFLSGIGTGDFRDDAIPIAFSQQVSGAAGVFTGSTYYNPPTHFAQIDVRGRLFVRNAGSTTAYIRLVRGTTTGFNAALGRRQEIWRHLLNPGFAGTVQVEASLPAYSAGAGVLFLQVYNQYGGYNSTDVTVLAGSAVTFAVSAPALLGAPVHLETTLPDISQADYLRLLFTRFNVALRVDAAAQTARFDLFNDLERRRAEAVDWSARLDYAQRPRLDYRLPGYAQRNTFTYKEAPAAYAPAFGTLTPAETAAQLGTDAVTVPDLTLPPLAESYAAPVVLPIVRAVAGGAAVAVYLPTATPAVPADPREAVPWVFGGSYRKGDRVTLLGRTWTCQTDPYGQRAQPGDANYLIDWLADPVPTTDLPTVASLLPVPTAGPLLSDEQLTAAAPASFGVPLTLTRAGLSFADLLPAYHEGTARILQRVQLVSAYFLLSAPDIAALDFTRPVRLDVRWLPGYGALRGLFYLNLIDQYRPGQAGPVRVELLKLGDPVAGIAPAATALPLRPARLLLSEAGQPLAMQNTDYITQE